MNKEDNNPTDLQEKKVTRAKTSRTKKTEEKPNKASQTGSTADINEIKEFWTRLLRDDEAKPQDRLKVSELLVKCGGSDKGDTPDDTKLQVTIEIVR